LGLGDTQNDRSIARDGSCYNKLGESRHRVMLRSTDMRPHVAREAASADVVDRSLSADELSLVLSALWVWRSQLGRVGSEVPLDLVSSGARRASPIVGERSPRHCRQRPVGQLNSSPSPPEPCQRTRKGPGWRDQVPMPRQRAAQEAWESEDHGITHGATCRKWYLEVVAPRRARVTLPAMARVTGASTSAASKLRAGRPVPHPRH
jgi:hypothetical protein